MQIQPLIPARVRLLVLGGGIHGVGVLHDMASRGWRDCFLVERARLASGTSSRSTKLIHGGLRYLRNPYDYGLVFEALHERRLLMELAGDIVRPLEFCLPIPHGAAMPGWMARIGLTMYDLLAGSARIEWNRKMTFEEVNHKLPCLDTNKIRGAYSFWDCQTDDVALTRRVAESAMGLGAGISESTEAVSIRRSGEGWIVQVKKPDGSLVEISALYVVNALGPWANHFLEQSNIKPEYVGINSKGVHLILPDMNMKIGAFLQSPKDGRIFFLLPWMNKTLVGTTETPFPGDPDQMTVNQNDIDYLLTRASDYLREPLKLSDVEETFAGLRWLHQDPSRSLKDTSRSFAIARTVSSGRGMLLTLYGGKLSAYRSLSEKVGDQIARHYGEGRRSETQNAKFWQQPGKSSIAIDTADRFGATGVGFTPKSSDVPFKNQRNS